jgi:ADP-heptose:LPS heptosyltransferase/lauroyl/myristoyl acyltransferase
MLTPLLIVIGWLLAHAPRIVLAAISAILGEAMLGLMPRRRRLIRSNLHHAFPEKPAAWRRRIARVSSRRLIETALLSLAAPHLSERRIRTMGRLGASVEGWAARAGQRPTVFATVHLALWESQTWLKMLSRAPIPEFGIIYRPLKNPGADAYVKRTRERFGMRLLSRRAGFAEALDILRGRGCVGVLFDQNAGRQGALTTFFDRVCSTTELLGMMAVRSGAELRTFYPRRTGFWRVEFESDPISHDQTAGGMTIALNRWLEGALRADEDLCASWLWAHDRWRNQDAPDRRFRLEAKRNLLAEELRIRGLEKLPKNTRVWVRLPNWLGDVVMALPLLRALRSSRPDAEITLVASQKFLPLLETWNIADRLHPLPVRGPGYFWHFWRLRSACPDVWLLFTNSIRGDLEARLAACPQRFGVKRPGRPRPLLTHVFALPADFDESRHHQIELWEMFLRHFGLEGIIDRTPFLNSPNSNEISRSSGPVGLIAGSENDPAKRWPVPHWRRLIEAMPHETFILFGTAGDRPITDEIASGFDPARIENIAGQTDLRTYASRLQQCRLLVANDTGGMHLANALGVPLIALFGPTNPVRTGPIFAAPFQILQPSGCPPTGGSPLADLTPESVIAAIAALIAALDSI